LRCLGSQVAQEEINDHVKSQCYSVPLPTCVPHHLVYQLVLCLPLDICNVQLLQPSKIYLEEAKKNKERDGLVMNRNRVAAMAREGYRPIDEVLFLVDNINGLLRMD
jgi:hypothetical protein